MLNRTSIVRGPRVAGLHQNTVRRAARLELLEQRRLLSVNIVDSVLIAEGTGGNDTIDLSISGGDLVVNINGASESRSLTLFQNILVNGLAGNDLITLEPGVPSARIEGGLGNDTMVAGTGTDTLVGGLGDDTYRFDDEWGYDVVIEGAGAGNDTMDLSAVSADLFWLIGALNVSDGVNSVAHGFTHIENLIGSAGGDAFNFEEGAGLTGTVDGGAGSNSLIYTEYTTSVTVDLGAGTATGTGGIQNIDNVTGGAGDDNLTGDGAANRLDGGPGSDTLAGGGGNDQFVFSDTSGSDTISGPGSLDFSAYPTALTFLIGDEGVSVMDGETTLATGPLTLQGLTGGAGDDAFVFEDGVVFQGTLDGGAGSNTLDYRAYSTSVVVNLATGVATGAAGVSRIDNAMGGSAADILAGNAFVNRLQGFGGNDKITGADGNDLLHGGDGNDVIKGGNGNDTIRGDAGDNKLYGNAGNDRLTGGAGKDRIDGGTGRDVLTGGAGNDVLLARDGERDYVRGGDGTDKAKVDELDRPSAVEIFLR